MTAPDLPPPDPTHRPAKLRCPTCGKLVPCTDGELVGYAGGAWPRCCGETMSVTDDDGTRRPANPT